MAISFRASTTFTAGNYTSVAAHAKPAGTAIGDVVVASMYIEATGLSPVIASTGDTWTLVHEITNTTPTPDMTHYVWIGVIGNASSTAGVTWGGGSFWADFTLTGFPGVDNATPQEGTATENSGTSTTPTALGIAEITAGSWLVMCTTNFAGNASSGSTLTERHDNENVAVFAAASSSSANQTATITSSSWTAIMLRLRPAPVTTTRFYLPSSGTAGASPTISADWEHSSGIRRPMSPTKGTTALTSTAYTPDAADHLVNGDALHVQFVSEPLLAQTIAAQTVTISVKGLMAHANNFQSLTWKLFVWTAAGAVGSTVLAIRRDTTYTTALINRTDSATTTSVSVGDGDRLVLEIGTGGTPVAAGGVQGHNATLRWGENGATDAPANDTSTSTTENPWLEFANTILFQAVFATTGSAAMRVRARTTISHVNSETVTYDDPRYTYNHPTLTYDGGWAGVGVAAARVQAAATSTGVAYITKNSTGTVAARIQARATIATPQPTFGTAAARIQSRATVTAGRAISASISARGTIRGAAIGQKGHSLSVALRVGARVTTGITSASTATAALRAGVRLGARSLADVAVVTDSFNRTDSPSSLGTADSGQVWSALVGTWGISGNKAVVALVVGKLLAVVESGRADASIQVTLSPVPSSSYGLVGVVLRVQDATNYLVCRLIPEAERLQLLKVIGGVETSLQYVGYGPTTTSTLRVEANGTTVTCYVDDELIITQTGLTDFQTATKHGLYASPTDSTTWEDFSVSTQAEGPGKASTTALNMRVAARSSIFTGRVPSFAALRAAARVTATAAAAHTAVTTAQSRIRAALAGTAAHTSASAGRIGLRLQAPSEAKASLGVVTIGGTAAAATPATLTHRLGLADLCGTARAATLIAPRAALGEVHVQTALRAQSDGLSKFTLYWPPATLLTPVHLGWAYRGDTLILPVWQAVDQRGNLISLEGATVWFTAKADLADTDAEPLTIQCSTLIGGVEIIDAALGSYQVIVPAGETQQLDEDTRFTFDVQVVTAIPTTHTVRRGTLIVVRDVTRSVA